jgi:hypothetical protein
MKGKKDMKATKAMMHHRHNANEIEEEKKEEKK